MSKTFSQDDSGDDKEEKEANLTSRSCNELANDNRIKEKCVDDTGTSEVASGNSKNSSYQQRDRQVWCNLLVVFILP